MLEDSDSTYMEPLTPGVKRPWEAVSQWGEYGNDSTTPLIYPHKKTRVDQELDISNDAYALEFRDAIFAEPIFLDTTSSQHIYAHNVDNNIEREFHGTPSSWNERQTLSDSETRGNALSTICPPLSGSAIQGDVVTILESSEGASYDTCFGVVSKTARSNILHTNRNYLDHHRRLTA
ncbi:hypothetical protein K445DRAFT_320764 [Daldinia sp. EC12]|nr:hypothetical protein K445DRAFT_320764 [Daldinia sp. EC12]